MGGESTPLVLRNMPSRNIHTSLSNGKRASGRSQGPPDTARMRLSTKLGDEGAPTPGPDRKEQHTGPTLGPYSRPLAAMVTKAKILLVLRKPTPCSVSAPNLRSFPGQSFPC